MTRETVTAAYHADARVMARMGYAPESEHWSTVLEQVLAVRYVHAPEQTPAVLAALAQAEGDPALAAPRPASVQRTLERVRRLYGMLPPEGKLSVGALSGVAAGIALCLSAATISGDSPDAISLAGFGLLGLLMGSIVGITEGG